MDRKEIEYLKIIVSWHPIMDDTYRDEVLPKSDKDLEVLKWLDELFKEENR